MKDIVIIIEDLTTFVKKGQDLVFKKEAEEAIVDLLEYRDKIDEAISQIKKGIEESGKKVSPDFKGVIGSKIKAIYRYYGERYEFDKSQKEKAQEFLKSITFFKVDSEKVDSYIEKVGKVPEGIKLKDRQPVISLSLIKPQLEDGKEK